MEKRQQVERSIIKKYKKPIWNRFIGGIKDYRLIAPGDRIAVCISGGKDSMLLAKCMQHLQLYTEIPFEVEYLVMDPGYRPENRRLLLDNAALLGLPVKVFDTRLFELVDRDRSATSPCYLCARMRRGCLYSRAQELGCNKIALGHHFDDVIETVLMSMLYGAEVRTMMPKLHSAHFPGMELIRPLYLVREADILSWQRYNGLAFLQCACRMTERAAEDRSESKRAEIKRLISNLRKINPQIDKNIFKSVENVNLETLISYRKGAVAHSFLEDYDG